MCCLNFFFFLFWTACFPWTQTKLYLFKKKKMLLRTYPKVACTSNGKLAPKLRVSAHKLRVRKTLEYDIFWLFSNRFLQIYLVIFNSVKWEQVQINFNTKFLKLRYTKYWTCPLKEATIVAAITLFYPIYCVANI